MIKTIIEKLNTKKQYFFYYKQAWSKINIPQKILLSASHDGDLLRGDQK
jgi:hypothetical protein